MKCDYFALPWVRKLNAGWGNANLEGGHWDAWGGDPTVRLPLHETLKLLWHEGNHKPSSFLQLVSAALDSTSNFTGFTFYMPFVGLSAYMLLMSTLHPLCFTSKKSGYS